MALPVPIKTYKKMIHGCLGDYEVPSGTSKRQEGRKHQAPRDAALLALAFTYGATSSELVNLKADACTPGLSESGTISFPGRPSRSKALPLIGATREILNLWFGTRKVWLDTQHRNSYAFYPTSKYAEQFDPQITQSGLRRIVRKRHDALDSRHRAANCPNPQRLRSSFKELLKKEGIKDRIVRDLMGRTSRRQAPRDDEKANEKMEEALRLVVDLTKPEAKIPSP